MFFELINRLKVRSALAGFKAHTGYSSSVQEERGLLGHRVYMIIILILCKWKESNPVVLPLINEESRILFQFLVNPLCLSITLRMIICSHCEFNAQKSIKFLHELHHELWASI